MERAVLLEVWRESCRHIELSAAWGRIAEVVGRRLAFRCLFLRRIDAGRGWIDTLAAADRTGAPVDVARRTEADTAAIAVISDWAGQGRMLHRSCSALEAQLPGLVPGDRWCLCAARWKEALAAGCAPPILLGSTHERALEYVTLEELSAHALDLN